ncbi:MAG: bifunctional 5,6,7,8-tetrahydromethanopterin hydro-lyase/3-hexulose-6-phosphate synthase [Canidatus Methanoxibalbensis ujae]|nr:bifunctional 5,6,7,8-tetrahydromethanopterin hydro-lyase/3-hexulose-6-phosphate synthase [Candidatus Methanoxibalbensis ujae]MCW7077947.1 bifunctional 5,6,7,8-tetrahydromethanopterin hydro-lyase/3-hexulose-6-phosphate synthase [Candidatus Methanoxibalbensis ujae]
MYIGEALVGEGAEVAHVDLIIGSKYGPVGVAFSNALSQLSAGHTPLLAVIRPNLPTKPSTIVIPKVTVRNMKDAEKIFGPAQSAVAKAIADAVEEGIIPADKAEDMVVIASVFIHPRAKDYNKIYRYNYGAAKLAVKRAMEGFPDVKKVLYEKDRSRHPLIGMKVTKLWDPPYLQIALDIPSWEKMERVVRELPKSDHLIIEVGTPLIKKYGVSFVERVKEIRPETFVVADFKVLDTGNLEARIVADAGGDAVVISGLAAMRTIQKAIEEAHKTGIYAYIDMMNVPSPAELLRGLGMGGSFPDVVEMHRAIDVEVEQEHAWGDISEIKNAASGKVLVAVAGGIREDTAPLALRAGAEILVVGRAVTNAQDVEGACRRFLRILRKEEIDQYRVMTDF